MAGLIEAHLGVFYLLQPVSAEVSKTLEKCGWRKHAPRPNCRCPLCETQSGIAAAWWTLDATCAQVTGLEMSATASLLVDRAKDRGRASRATDARVDVELASGQLRPFQRAGVRYALDCFERGSGVLIGDEMGLGKTIQAIAACLKTRPGRVMIECPASLRLNWQREVRMWAGIEAVQLDGPEDVSDGAGWSITNCEKLITTAPKVALEIVQRASPDSGSKGLRRYLKANEGAGRALWIRGKSEIDKDLSGTKVFTIDSVPADWKTREGMTVIAADTVGAAIAIAHEHPDVWTHVVGFRVVALGEQQRAGGLWERLLRTPAWDVLIIDEAHRFANLGAASTSRVLGEVERGKGLQGGLAQRAKNIIALTGTPMSNRPRELDALLRAISPEFSTCPTFLMRYCGATQKEVFVRGQPQPKKVWDFNGASRLPELQARLRRNCMVRRTKEQVLPDLPPQTNQVIPITTEALSAAAAQEKLVWLADPAVGDLTLGMLVAEACDNQYEFQSAAENLASVACDLSASEIALARKEIALAKLPVAIEHIRNVLASIPCLVVMAHHREVIDQLSSKLPGSVKLYGGMTDAEKQASVDAFQGGQSKVFVGSLKAAGVGLTLTAADTMVFVEDDWVPAVVQQTMARIHRIGQTKPVFFQHLVADGTIETMIIRSILKKQNIIDQALDGASVEGKSYPVASLAERKAAAEKIQQWSSETSADFDANTMQIVRQIARRIMRRAPTDGEVSLVKKLQDQLKKARTYA